MTTVSLTCLASACFTPASYRLEDIELLLFTHGIFAVRFTCQWCENECEYVVPEKVAVHLDRLGVTTTVVRVPDEVVERADMAAPAITSEDVGFMERSTLTYFNDCVRRELSDAGPA